MIILSWNCRGIGHPAAIPYLCDLNRTRRPDVIFLCETLARTNKLEEIRLSLHYECAFTVNSVGRSEGLCLLWKKAVTCDILSYSNNHIDVIMNDESGRWRFTGYYGFPDQGRRNQSWNLLRHLASVNSLPWLIMGDFNDLLSSDDKEGGAAHPNWLFRGFREAILDCNVTDVPLTGHKFTWCRGRGTKFKVEERLDRAMGNPLWHTKFDAAWRLRQIIAP